MNHFFPCKDLARQHSGGRSATLTRGLSRETGTPTAARKGTPFRPFEMFGGRRRSSVAGADEEATAGFGAAMKFGAVASTAQASAAAAATALSNLQSLARRGRGSVVAHLHGIGERGARNNDRGDGEQSEEKHQEGGQHIFCCLGGWGCTITLRRCRTSNL